VAGLGRKIFVSGEILTAADLQGYAVDQSVMVFDDDTARTAAIPTPAEGMVTYLKDEDAVTFYDGSAFKRVGGLIEVKSALKTDTFSASVTAGNNVSVTGLSITHTMQNANNKLIISAFFGVAANSNGRGQTAIAVADGGTLIGIGDTDGTRVRLGSGGPSDQAGGNVVTTQPSVTFVYLPADTASHTYTVEAINAWDATNTIYVNRNQVDTNSSSSPRGASGLVIQEVAV
jgi:hypothetical protein